MRQVFRLLRSTVSGVARVVILVIECAAIVVLAAAFAVIAVVYLGFEWLELWLRYGGDREAQIRAMDEHFIH